MVLASPTISLLWSVSLCFAYIVLAQDYTIPLEWQNVVSNISYPDRLSIAFGAANELQHKIDPSTGYPEDVTAQAAMYSNRTVANMVIALAFQDWRSGNNSWKEQVENNTLAFYEAGKGNLDNRIQNIDTSTFGLAEIAAYLAYGNDSSRLEIAIRNFNIIYSDFVSSSAAQSGKFPHTLHTSCGSTLGGLLFFNHDPSDLTVHASGIGSWIALSARLYELTQNTTYLSTAAESIQFMQTYQATPNASISGGFDPKSCYVWDGLANPDDIGFYIEGLSILANVTANQTYVEMLEGLIPFVVSFRNWHTDDGILSIDPAWCSKGVFMRGLLEVRLRIPFNTGLVALIDTYLTIQFNAVRTNAFISGNDYALSWHTLSHSQSQPAFSTLANVDALDALNAAFVIASTNNSSPTNSTNPANVTSPVAKANPDLQGHTSISAGVIVGAVVGGTAVSILALAICYRRRRRRTPRTPTGGDQTQSRRASHIPEPFILASPPHDQTVPMPKGGNWQRLDISTASSSTTDMSRGSLPPGLSADVVRDNAAPVGSTQSLGDSDALHALEMRLERRLDSMIQNLAVRGETEGDPPEYDESGADRTAR